MVIYSNSFISCDLTLEMLCVKSVNPSLGLGPQQPVWLTCLGPAGKPLVL